MKNIAYYNGKISTLEELCIPVLDRAVYFGDGVYDVASINNGRFFALDDHLNRFVNSCRFIDITPPAEPDALAAIFGDLLERMGGIEEGILYWQASRGTAERNHPYPLNSSSNLLAYIKEKKLPDLTKRLKLITRPDIRYSMCNVKTINLIPNVIASQRAVEAGCDEAVFIRDGVVTECSHSNVSILSGGVLITHPLDNHILPGVARGHMLRLCGELGIPVEEREYGVSELVNADEILVTSTTKLCAAACELDGKPVGGRADEIVKRIQKAYTDKVNSATK